ncbi:hypothetical protein F2P56_010647 [Juglans regia]|uniref:Calcium-dependent protein kinase 2-like n=2 Tax=Juglans regia TaxID=51240 RepID=A0A2I4HAM8_JUGRE|nr:calcium-dependent protein kinase 2-like [Juglans regia]KAF5470107.1 hypothetical protein F2P56_010647 [Juglans regia]
MEKNLRLDFGLSVLIGEGKVYRDIDGSAYYVASKVLQQRYGKEREIWSAGFIRYILFSGVPPFWAKTEKEILDAIMQGEIDFELKPWLAISSNAKDLVCKMLTRDSKKMITSTQILEHMWTKEDGETSNKPIDSAVLKYDIEAVEHISQFNEKALKLVLDGLVDFGGDNSNTNVLFLTWNCRGKKFFAHYLFDILPLEVAGNTKTNTERSRSKSIGEVYVMVVGNALLFASTQDGSILAWRYNAITNCFEPAASLKGHTLGVVSLVVGANKLYSGLMDPTITLWKAI